jgi:hypothetical protein
MAARLRLRRWLLASAKIGGLLVILLLALVYLSPAVYGGRTLTDVLNTVFVNNATRWYWAIPITYALAALAWVLVNLMRQRQVNRQMEQQGVVRIILPRVDSAAQSKDAVQFWNQVSDLIPPRQHVTFELTGSTLGVQFALCAMSGVNRALVTQAMADWPGTQSRPVTRSEDDPLFVAPGQAVTQIMLQPRFSDRPIATAVTDVLAPPLVEIARLPVGVKGGVLILVRNDFMTRQKLGQVAARETAEAATGKSLEQKRTIKAADTRAQHVFLEVQLIVWAAADSPPAAQKVARSLARSVKAQYEASNPLVQVKETHERPRRVFPLFAGRPWTDEELATLAHLTGKTGAALAPQLETAPARPLPPSSECRIPPESRTVIHLANKANGGAVSEKETL